MKLTTMHGWDKEHILSHAAWLEPYGYTPEKMQFWVLRESGRDWAYVISGPGYSWRDCREGHIRMAIAEGVQAEEVNLEYFK